MGEELRLGTALGGGGCSAFTADGEDFGVGDSRWFAFLVPRPELFSLSLDPTVPGTFALGFNGLTDGLTDDVGEIPRSLSPVGVPVARTGWLLGSAASPV